MARNVCSKLGESGIRIEPAGPILPAVVQTDEMERCAGNGKLDDLVSQKRNMGIVCQTDRNLVRSCIAIMVPKAGKDSVPGVEVVQIGEEVWDTGRIGVQDIAGQENEVWLELIDFLHIGFEFLRGQIRPNVEITDLRNCDARTCGWPMGKGEFEFGYVELALATKVAIDEEAGNENETPARKELKAQRQRGLNRQVEFGKGEEEAACGDEAREESPYHSTQHEKNEAKDANESRSKINTERETKGCGKGRPAAREAEKEEIQAKKDW